MEMQRRNMRNRVICFSGIDGSGKTAHARLLFEELEAAGTKCQYKWLRYPHFLALLPLAIYEPRNFKGKPSPAIAPEKIFIKSQIKVSRPVTTVWALILFVDSLLSMARNVYLPVLLNYTLIVDRFAIDTLLDIALDLREEGLIFSTIGKMFLRLVPRKSVVLIFDVEKSLAASRKGSLEDESLSRKSDLYKRLGQIYHWNVISTEAPFPEVHARVLKLVNQA